MSDGGAQRSRPDEPAPSAAAAGDESARRARLVLAALVLLALGLRLANAWWSSLHLDDFHTLYHARAQDLAEFFARVRQDNHPPLFFLLVRWTRAVFGEAELALRLPAVASGVALVPVVWSLARRLPGLRARALATLLVACSSLNLELSADLRMYSLLTLALGGLLAAAADLLESRAGFGRAVLWTVVGLHTHYHFVHALAVIVAACAGVGLVHASARAGARRLFGAVLAAGLVSAPWYAWGFTAQLAHGLPPGGSTVSIARLLEGLVHLVFLNVRLGGAAARVVFLAGGAVVVGLAGLAAVRIVLGVRAQRSSAAWLVLVAAAFLLPAWSALAAWITPRAGFEWRYIAGAVTPLALLAARGAWTDGPLRRTRRVAAEVAAVAALALCLLNVRDPGREDNRAAVRSIVTRSRVADAVVAAEWQPRLFPHSGAWSFYAPRLLPPGGGLPRLIDHEDDFTFPPGTDFSPYERVFFLGRSIPDHMPILQRLRAEFPRERAEQFGMSIWVVTFEREERRG